jgi:rare lipoprotein A
MHSKFYTFSFLLIFVLMLTGCATTRGTTIDSGVASWYGPNFHGKLTANGEVYDQHELTAAHRTLPFNTVVKVTNLDNGKSVTVRINDRGPYAHNRIIDLSHEAARQIDMIGPGTANVRVQLVSSEAPVSRRQGPELFAVQLASYTSKSQADEFARTVRGAYVQSALIDRVTYYRVYVGKFRDRDDAARLQSDLERQGHSGFVKQIQN